MTELISTTEGAILLAATAVLLVWLLLLAYQTYRCRQISLATLVTIAVSIACGIVTVGVLFAVYGMPKRTPQKLPEPLRPAPAGSETEGNTAMKNVPVQKLPKGYVCYRAATPPVLDGSLADPVWQDAPWTDFFVDIEGDRKPLPLLKTRAKMLWDSAFLYIGASLQEPHVWATLTEKNAIIFNDNDFEVFIDPDGDNHNYYELELNALNTIWELTLIKPYKDGGPPIHGTNIEGLRSAVHVNGTINDARDIDRGWSLEVAIPWAGFTRYGAPHLPPEQGDQWRMNFSRVEWPLNMVGDTYTKVPDIPESNWVWSPQGVVNMHCPETWGYVQFSTAVPGTDTFAPDASLAARKLLMAVYYAQHRYHDAHARWAPQVEELDLSIKRRAAETECFTGMDVSPDGFVAHVALKQPDGTRRTFHVNHESRLWEE